MIIMKKYILTKFCLAAILFFLLACSENREKEITRLLTGGSQKYWLRVNKFPILFDCDRCNRDCIFLKESLRENTIRSFNINGESFTYNQSSIFDKSRKIEDPLETYVWRLENDTAIILNNHDYHWYVIEHLSEDMLMLRHGRFNTYSLWIPAPKSLVEKDFNDIFDKNDKNKKSELDISMTNRKILDNLQHELEKQVKESEVDGIKIEWHFTEKSAMEEFIKHLEENGGKELLEKETIKYNPSAE